MAILTKGINVVKNIVGSAYLIEIEKLSKQYQNTIILLDNNHQIDSLYDELVSLYQDKIILKFPNYGVGDYDINHIDKNIIKDRYNTLISIQKNNKLKKILITTYKSIFNKIPDINDSKSSWVNISKESKYNEIIDTLNIFQYRKVSKVEELGQYRVSGSIIDYFSLLEDKPIRVNFFGDDIETIKKFNTKTQLSEFNVDISTISATGIYHLTNDNIKNYISFVSNTFEDEYKEDLEFENITNDQCSSNIQNLIPSFYNDTLSLLSLFKDEFVCFTQKNITDEYEDQFNTMNNIYNDEIKNRYILNPTDLLITNNELDNIIKNNYIYFSSELSEDKNSIKTGYSTLPSLVINYNYKNPFINFDNLYKSSSYDFIFFIDRDDNFKTLTNYFDSNDLEYKEINNIDDDSSCIKIYKSNINQGFIDNHNKKTYISSNDLFGLIKTRVSKNKSIKSILIDNLSDLKVNEFIVHQEHGIGKYKGLITMEIESKVIELIKIEYADNNNLYIPITSISLIQRYIGNAGLNTKLANLGTDRWLKVKQRAKKKIEDIAAELLRVQANRELNLGYKYTFDNHTYEKFCKLFPYVETEDQLDCINNVIEDMCSQKSMDRVVCGDVGFGKTEVILRASFLAATNNKQVIIIVPTTVLAKQHYQTFKKRFSNYNYTISLMTRVLTALDKTKTINDIKDNNVHIIIGTHALLNKNIKYYDLGLLIIDEEHKFGVKHKEAIKSMKENIDVLSLTATPIPRTLNSALSEIKDMSIINTPPIGRRDIETRTIERTQENIKEYIDRELNRGGQILFIHNNIDSMDEEINFLKIINDNYRIGKVHGRLSNNEIENVMNNFIHEDIDILVCTSIVESGLDMANVNTIIINNAQNFGLSQLHQIRGRVGRSNKQAYAALILCDYRKMTKEAERRVGAFIKTNSLAGGLDIAGHDLDIRGAGEILGEEQSGQIFEIGYGMYTSMLSRAINQIKNKKDDHISIHTEVDAYISTLIPQDYIEDIFIRLEFYSDISNVTNEHQLNEIIIKMIDIYGPIPEYLENLLHLTKVRIASSIINADKIKINKDNSIITLNSNSLVDRDLLLDKYVIPGKIKLSDQYNLKYQNSLESNFEDKCNNIIDILKAISN